MDKITRLCSEIISYNRPSPDAENLRLLYSLLDLTNLNSAATNEDIAALCQQAAQTLHKKIEIPQVAAVCIYPVYVKTCKELLANTPIKVATVSGVFPHAQSFAEVKYLETEMALAHGADEIDMVLNLSAFLNKKESVVFDEIKAMRQICGNHHLKVILETGLLKDYKLIEDAARIALEAGADFIKTSTGKDGSVASLEAAYIMCKTIKDFYRENAFIAGFKPAGGISDTDMALNYLAIVAELLGEEWLFPERFRIGASRLALNLLHDLEELEK